MFNGLTKWTGYQQMAYIISHDILFTDIYYLPY